jgi:hypothetical protein
MRSCRIAKPKSRKERNMDKRRMVKIGSILALFGLAGCAGDGAGGGSGALTVILESEESITAGLDPGDEVENIQDGWRVRYDRFIAAVGDIEVQLATDESVRTSSEDVFVVDLKAVSESGLALWNLSDLRSGRWEFNYATPGTADGATRHESVTQADFDQMRTENLTYLIVGSLSKADGRSCPPPSLAVPGTATPSGMNRAGHPCYANTDITFNFGANAETSFGPCEVDGISGFSIAGGSTQTVAATIHGDHVFFNGFPEGDEGGIVRLAQWLADCDLNLDGAVTQQELEAIAPSALGELDSRFQLGGSPITPLNTMWQYVIGQLKTQGHMNGEGECPFDGRARED